MNASICKICGDDIFNVYSSSLFTVIIKKFVRRNNRVTVCSPNVKKRSMDFLENTQMNRLNIITS